MVSRSLPTVWLVGVWPISNSSVFGRVPCGTFRRRKMMDGGSAGDMAAGV